MKIEGIIPITISVQEGNPFECEHDWGGVQCQYSEQPSSLDDPYCVVCDDYIINFKRCPFCLEYLGTGE